MDSELTLDGNALNIIARSDGTIRLDQELRNCKQRNALDAFRCPGHPGQNHVNDIAGQVVFAVGDEDLLTLDPVAAIHGRHRSRAHRRQVRPGLRLSEVHRARPFSGDQPRQVGALLHLRAAQLERVYRPAGQHRAQREGHIGAVPHLLDERRKGPRQILATEFRRTG